MEALWWIIIGLFMSAIAMVGSLTLVLKDKTLRTIQTPLVAFAAGSLISGVFLHMIPAGLIEYDEESFFLWILSGFGFLFNLNNFYTGDIANKTVKILENH